MRKALKTRKIAVLTAVVFALSLMTLTQFAVTQVRADAIQASVNVDPDSLLLKEEGYGKWMTAYIELPEGYEVSRIDVSSIAISVEGITVPVLEHSIQGDTLMVKFDRAYVVSLLWSMKDHMSLFLRVKQDLAFEVNGQLDGGLAFEGSDTVEVFYTQL